MTRKERIQELEQMISEIKIQERKLRSEIAKEKIQDFYESNGMKEGQHFMYDGKECVGVEYGDYGYLKTHRITKNGEVSKIATIIYSENITPIEEEKE